ncbi:MAG: hypothetical protein HYZ50_17200 [Deltaproteobacteria bacterium]|nr:hypothetical protein [Deltaproteobacteria bacterium]
MADKEVERIKFETELLRVTAVAALAIGGGSVGLLLGEPKPLHSSWQVGDCSLQWGSGSFSGGNGAISGH